MTKRILAFVIVLAMLICALPVNVIHAEQEADGHTHSDAHACGPQCAGGTVTWIPWGDTAEQKQTLPAESGHYYLTADVLLTARHEILAGKDITLCLNGWSIKAKANERAFWILGKLTISDCTAATDASGNYTAGTILGSTASDGAIFNIRRGGGTLVVEDGIITGGKTTSTAGGGAVYTQATSGSAVGGKVYMYGGRFTGNEGYHGGAICLGGAGSEFHMYGGSITGNKARGNGGGLHTENNAVVELCGGSITGNTSTGNAEAAQAVNMAGASSKLTVCGSVQLDGVRFASASNAGLKVNGLTDGTRITLTTQNTDITKNVSLAPNGSQTDWSAHWLTANGEPVSLVNDAFTFGHYHGTVKYTAFVGSTNHNTLPNGGNRYYLANDITRNTDGGAISIAAGATQYLCLNGHTVTHRNPAGRLYNISGNFVLEDCSAYTDDGGKYISGGITYDGAAASTKTYGMGFWIARGGTMTITDGQIYGFNSAASAGSYGATIYLQGANDTGKAVMNLQGGQIHSNTALCNGAAVAIDGGSNHADPSQFHMTGGEIYGNKSTGTGTNGGHGAAFFASSAKVTLSGGKIYGNTASQQGGGVYLGTNNVKLTISGNVQIIGNSAAGKTGNLYLGEKTVIQAENLSGAVIGVDAANTGRAITNSQQSDISHCFRSDNAENKISFKNNCVYMGSNHEHGIDGGAGDVQWSAWTSKNSLPTQEGSYYLTQDVQLTDTVTIKQKVDLCLNGKTITAKSGSRAVTVAKGGELTITDCQESCGTITGGSSSYGGAFNVQRGAVLNLYAGSITGNTGKEEGGAVYLQAANAADAGGVFYMYGGEITGNSAKRGAAVCLAGSDVLGNQAAFTLQGGSITGNTADNGGAVYSYQNTVIRLQGGSITGNTAETRGGGLYIHRNLGLLAVSGTPVVEGNRVGRQNSNIHLCGEKTVQVDTLESGAKLFVTAEKAKCYLTNALSGTEAACFHSDSAYRSVEYKDGRAYLDASGDHGHCACFYKTQGCDHTEVKWEKWDNTKTLPTVSGYYYLAVDVQLSAAWTVPADQQIYLCLNGKTVTAAEGKRVALVRAGAVLNLTDCTGSGKLTGGSSTYGGAINLSRGSVCNLYGGNISGNTGATNEGLGGAVYMQAAKPGEPGAVMNMYGGNISGNNGQNGGAISVAAVTAETDAAPAALHIYGGTVANNTARNSGGAIHAGDGAVLDIRGGSISGNSAASYGGAVFMVHTKADITGGIIQNNISTRDGGGVYAIRESQVQISGDVKITDNRSQKGAGGGVGLASKAKLTFSGGTVSGNRAGQAGGVIVQSGAQMEMTGGSVTRNRAATSNGGGIYVYKRNDDGTVSSLKMTGGTVSGNNAEKLGGGIYMFEAKGQIDSGSVSGNTSAKDGAGIFCAGGQVTMGSGLKVTGNNCTKGAGGGVGFSRKCNVYIHGTTISHNQSAVAGGMIVQSGAKVQVSGGYLGDNTSKKNGGGAYIVDSQATFTGVTIANNSTERYGGGMFISNSQVTMQGSTVRGNHAVMDTAGVHCYNSQVDMEKVLLTENTSDRAAGGVCATRSAKLTMKDCTVAKNMAQTAGGVLVQNWSAANLTDVTICENQASDGAGLYVAYFADDVYVNGGVIKDNVAKTRVKTNGTVTGGVGAGIYHHSSVNTRSGSSRLYVNQVQIENNQAELNGAGVYVGYQMHTYLDGCTIQNNTAGDHGAGIYQATGSKLFARNTKIVANTAGKTGSGIYAGCDMELDGCVITGNRTKEGAAVYVAPSRYDGHSYVNATVKLGGDLQICDNEGTLDDLYFDEGAVASGTAEGFGANTKVRIQLHSGILTNALVAAYNYEGGDQHYVVTYGDRSLTDPEELPVEKTGETQPPVQNLAICGIVAVAVLAAAAAVLLILGKKKKKAAREAAKD